MISVLVVDDSVVIRRLVTDALGSDPRVRVVGTAPNGRVALQKIDQLKPDLVTLDVEMPVMDGVTAAREIRLRHPKLPIIMFSTLTSSGAEATLAALSAGASDYVTKPSNFGSVAESVRSVREELLPRIHALCERPRPMAAPPPVRRPAGGGPRPARGQTRVVVVASSTGGPTALRQVLRGLPARLSVPIVVVQHMPPVFTGMLAQRLDTENAVRVVEATDGMILEPGTVYIAPGDRHLEVAGAGKMVKTRLHDGPKENHCRPAADVLFRSAARVYGNSALAVVLTGMGRDGAEGCRALSAAGAQVLAQDQASSVVWGMPGAVVEAGLADAVVPLGGMADRILSALPVPEVAS
ncbi:chemotaxis response regulator protein-glutamate methylesterase [Saccharothrix violaceirubra]|uniref:Protein-glutamate methylesterase/protein-glutamine glutaminase n=1 Tax=Saccharothrix violaceirubra TaxID=413306 RepID=A0A7W7WZ38_9PSEU|nr:chemotaxis response regulator protein-glutamate methylesterase [Saccharothrix violaceirubra]MBB4968388.1 two-component system chemotaxis response regulator CheB [Saccharothrix violaceirubra]